MNDLPVAYLLGVNAAVREARSALPDARTLPERVRTPGRARSTMASWLHAAADRISPSARVRVAHEPSAASC